MFIEPPVLDGGAPRWSTAAAQIAIISQSLEDESLASPRPAIRHGIYQFNKKGLRVVTETFGPKIRTEGAIALVRGEKDKDELTAKLEEAFDAMGAAGIAAPLFLMFVPPIPDHATRICIVKSKNELLAASKL